MLKVFITILTAFAVLAVPAVAEVDDAAIMAKRPAKLLSAYGLFSDLSAQEPAERVIPYELSVPLFSDYALKYRFFYLPEGKQVAYRPKEVFEFPVGAALVKTFAYPADFRAPSSDIRLIETRLLIRQETGWAAWAYVWNEDQSDAVLKVVGARMPVSWIDAQGNEQSISYRVPNRNQCKGCHIYNGEIEPIGPKARHLNIMYKANTDIKENQINLWNNLGFIKDIPNNFSEIQVISNEISDQAKAYLDINCAHCHRAEGPASTSGLFLTYDETSSVARGIYKTPVAAGRGSEGLAYDILPQNPDQSILLRRMMSTDPGVMMPELGRATVHKEGVALIRQWIEQLEK